MPDQRGSLLQHTFFPSAGLPAVNAVSDGSAMNNYRNPIFLLAVTFAAAAGVAFATRLCRQQQKTVGELQHGSNLKTWENEGGNLAPAMGTAVPLAAQS
jgi:hypothetical protein